MYLLSMREAVGYNSSGNSCFTNAALAWRAPTHEAREVAR